MYRRSAQIEQFNTSLAALVPSMVTHIPLDPSLEGRSISAIRIRGGDAENRRGVLFIGGTHARELLNPDALVDLALDLVLSYLGGSDVVYGGKTFEAQTVKVALDALDLFILPNLNPDGREYVFDEEPLWRKNRRQGDVCDGVDLNRNYGLLHGIETVAPMWGTTTSTNPCFDVFCGPSAFSEPETVNVKNMLDTYRIECVVDVHSYSELILHPWGHAPNQTTDPSQRFTIVDTSGWETLPNDAPGYEEYIDPADLERFQTVGTDAAQAIHDVRGRTYTVEPGTGLYPTTGTTSDYVYARHIQDPTLRKVYGFTMETGPWTGSAETSFQPGETQQALISQDARAGLVSILISCVCAIDLIGSDLFGADHFSLSAMRSARDTRLAATPAGRSWIALVERHQMELARILLADRALMERAGPLLEAAGRILRDDEPLTPELVATGLALAEEIVGRGASEELVADLSEVRALAGRFQGRTGSELVDGLTKLRRTPPQR